MHDSPTFLVQEAEDAVVLRRLGANVLVMGEQIGVADGDVILLTREGGRDLLKGMNLGLTGRFVDLGQPLADCLQGANDPVGLLDAMAHDIFWHEERPLRHWSVPELVPGKSSGFPFLDPHLRWTHPELVVLLAPYGCGKSSLARLLAFKWADTIGRDGGWRVSLVGWEDRLTTIKREIGRYAGGAQQTFDMEGRVGWTQRHPDDARLIQWYCELVEHRAKRDGVRFFVFDPFNEHDSTRGKNQTETEYIRDVMTRLRRLTHELGIIMIVVTHVSAKSYDETGKIKPFRIANAAGSVQFGNRCDRGICLLRTKALKDYASELPDANGELKRPQEHMILHFDKAKDEEVMGKRGTIACVFDPLTMSLTHDLGATMEARKLWP